MAIDVVWQNESGATLATCSVPWEERMGRSAILERSHCLQYIDPYRDVTSNQLQLPQLVRELEQAAAQIHGTSLRDQANTVVAFVRGCIGIHTYVKFIGD